MFKVTVEGETLNDLTNNMALMLNAIEKPIVHHGGRDFLDRVADAAQNVVQVAQTLKQHETPQHEQADTQAIEAAPVQATGELDAKSLPWDARIHAESRRKNKDNTWTNKRGLDAAFLASVEAELKGKTHTLAPPSAPVFQMVQPQNPAVAPQVTPVSPALSVTPSSPQPSVQTPSQSAYENIPVPEGVKPAHTLETFKANLIPCLATLVKEKKIKQAYIEQLKSYFKIDEIWKVNGEQLAEMYAQFCALGLITKVD